LVAECTSLEEAISIARKDNAALVALSEREPTAPWPSDLSGPIALVIGPEGGFENDEIALLRDADAWFAGLGPTIVRAETAAATAVGAVRLIRCGLLSP
jgi:16S rRNA (uracil1498-N3)-methyltransferase